MSEPVKLDKPLSETRLALVTTGGVHLASDERFDIDDPAGDCSYREIPSLATDLDDLTWTHAYYADRRAGGGNYADRRAGGGRREDLDCVFPLWTLLGLAEEGVVGELNRRHFSFMGAIHETTELEERTAPEVARSLSEDAADAVLLIPS